MKERHTYIQNHNRTTKYETESIFRQVNFSEMERLALSALCENTHCAESLAELLGAKHFIVVNKLIGNAGKKLFEASPPDSIVRSWLQDFAPGHGWYHVIAPGFRSTKDKKFYWEIRPEWKSACMSMEWYAVSDPLKDPSSKRKKRLKDEALLRANGQCERCLLAAPFLRKSNRSPYLEVHHKIPLSEDGPDTLDNVLALCPNCHREVHFG